MNKTAELGFIVPTDGLTKGKAALDALVPSAQKAEKAADRFNRAAAGITAGTGGAAAGIKSFSTAAMGASASGDRLSKAALASSSGLRTVQAAAIGAMAPMNNLVATTARVGTTFQMADAHVEAYKASLAGVPAAANGASTSLARLGAAANDNINRLQSTPGNIAAQFQDIGVSAAGGMQPFLIALQQGTQLSAAMQGGLGNLIAGLRQTFNATTILTIGVVGLVAAGLQAVDWMKLAERVSGFLADALEECAVGAIYLGVVLAIAFAPRLIGMITTMSTSIGVGLVGSLKSATTAMLVFARANPFGLVVTAIGLVIGAMVLLNDRFGGIFTGILKVVKYVANAILRFFATAFNAVLEVAQNTVNGIIGAFESVANFLGLEVKVERVDFSGAKIDTREGRDFVGDIASFVQDAAGSGADLLRNAFSGDEVAEKAGGRDRASRGKTEAERQSEAYSELVKRAGERVLSLTDEANALGMTEAAARLYLNRQDLLRQAAEQGIALDEKRRTTLETLAQALTKAQFAVEVREQTRAYQEQQNALRDQAQLIGLTGLELEYNAIRQEMMNDAIERGIIDVENMTDAMRQYVAILGDRALTLAQAGETNRNAEFVADFTRDLDLQTKAMERSRGELGLSGAALTAYRIESDLLNAAARAQVELSPAQVEAIRAQASAYAELNEEVIRQNDLLNFARDTVGSLFTDIANNLREGQTIWQAFGNAVLNVLNRIIDKLLEVAAENLASALAGGGGGDGGILGSILGFAKGGAFDGGVQKFADGGAFTNGVYDNPTMFKFASGGQFGVMGEAGPEAVMPLKRGSDGSLGVQVQATEPQMITVTVVTNDDRFDAYVNEIVDAKGPTFAQAGAVVSQRDTAFIQARTLG